ncbi:hypothetical protein ACQY0O_004245 [Thecaphora frezii]
MRTSSIALFCVYAASLALVGTVDARPASSGISAAGGVELDRRYSPTHLEREAIEHTGDTKETRDTKDTKSDKGTKRKGDKREKKKGKKPKKAKKDQEKEKDKDPETKKCNDSQPCPTGQSCCRPPGWNFVDMTVKGTCGEVCAL